MKIHYFQRYHSKENVDTANTMLLLSRLYSYSASIFFKFLKSYILPENAEPEMEYVLQEKCADSIPDATISQKSFKIAIETKLYGQFSANQLENHLESFDNEEYKVLMTLDPKPMNAKVKKEFDDFLDSYNKKQEKPVLHCNITFESLINGIKSVIDDRDFEMIDVLNDYEDYCFSENLIPDAWKWMRVKLAGTTLDINKKLNLYYDNADHGFAGHEYIGLYNQKSVRAIGKISAIVVATKKEEQIKFYCEKGTITDEIKQRILDAIDDAKKYGYGMENERYFIVEQFYDTDFAKSTPNAMMGTKKFDLTAVLNVKKLPSTEEIACMLRNLSWE